MRKTPKILIGRAGIKIPFFERVDKLYLGQMTVDIKTESSVPTNDFINVNVDAVAKIRIGTTEEAIQLAAKNFLNKRSAEITEDLKDSLQGNMREKKNSILKCFHAMSHRLSHQLGSLTLLLRLMTSATMM